MISKRLSLFEYLGGIIPDFIDAFARINAE